MAKNKNFWDKIKKRIFTKEGKIRRSSIVYVLISAILLYGVNWVCSYAFPTKEVVVQEENVEATNRDADTRDMQNKIIMEENAIQFKAKITSSAQTDKPYVSDGYMVNEFFIENVGSVENGEIPPSADSKGHSGHNPSVAFSLNFFNEKKELISSVPYTVEKPIPIGEKSDPIQVKVQIPENTFAIRATLICVNNNPLIICKEPIIESYPYIVERPYVKVLIVDASRADDTIEVMPLRTKMQSVFGNTSFIKATWSSIAVGPNYMPKPMLLFNSKYMYDSKETKMIQDAVNGVYGETYQVSLEEMTSYNLKKGYSRLSDSYKDKNRQTNHTWENLDILTNRFSPQIFEKNPDIDFIIFLPSNV